MWKKIKVWRKQLLCVGTGMFLGAAAWILQERDPVIKEGNVLERPAADESYQEHELYVRGLVEKGGDIPFDLRIYPKHYTKEEAYNLYKEILDQIPEMIRGENISINEVQHDLELMTQWPRYGISLSWQSSEPEILENDGTLHTEKLEKNGYSQQICLTVRMSDGSWPEEYDLFVTVTPPLYTEKEQLIKDFADRLLQEEELQQEQQVFTLPSEYEGRSISYHVPRRPVFIQMSFLGAAAAVLLCLKEKMKLKRQRKTGKTSF